MDIYIRRDEQRYGPYSLDDIQSDLATGNVVPTDLAWYEGAKDWVPIARIVAMSPPKPNTTTLESILLVVLSFVLPPAGLLIGIIRIRRKRVEGWAMLATSVLAGFLFLCIPIAHLRRTYQSSTKPKNQQAYSETSLEPVLPRLKRALFSETYRAHRSYDAEINDVLARKASNDVTAKSAAQQFANGSYRLTDMLTIIAAQLDAQGDHAAAIEKVVLSQQSNDISSSSAIQQAANGSYRSLELLSIIAQEVDRKGVYRAQVQEILSRASSDDTRTKSAYQQIANGSLKLAEVLSVVCKAADAHSRFGSEIDGVLSQLGSNSSQTAMQESVIGLYASVRLLALFATLMDRNHIYADAISNELRQLTLSDATTENVYQQMAVGYYRLTDLAGYAAKALNP